MSKKALLTSSVLCAAGVDLKCIAHFAAEAGKAVGLVTNQFVLSHRIGSLVRQDLTRRLGRRGASDHC